MARSTARNIVKDVTRVEILRLPPETVVGHPLRQSQENPLDSVVHYGPYSSFRRGERTMRIGEVARKSVVGVETIRFYEQKGLIAQPPRPKTGGYRDYPADAVRRLTFIRSAQQLGFSLVEVAELLDLEAASAAQCVDVRQRAAIKRQEVQTKIDNLQRIRKALDVLIDACPGNGPARTCSILEAINSGKLRLSPMTNGGRNG